jgi:hypothetical protein
MKKLLPLLAVASLAAPVTSKADVQDWLYDFTDAADNWQLAITPV